MDARQKSLIALAITLPLAIADLAAIDVVAARWLGERPARPTSSTIAPATTSQASVAPAAPASSAQSAQSATPSASIAPSASSVAPSASASSAPTVEAGPLASIRFGSGTATVDDVAEAALIKVRDAMLAAPTRKVRAVGHADAIGDAKHNLWLGDFRARVVQRWLEQHGVPRERCLIAEVELAVASDAGVRDVEVDPLDPRHSADRRVDVVWEAERSP